MNRKIGFDNRLCYQREVARCQKIHQDKLRHIQPTSLSPAKGKLDNTAPQQHAHLKANFKKAQMDSDKYKQIYGENQQLMRKMLKICDAAPSDAAVEFRPGMRLNTDQTPLLDSYVSVQSLTRGCAIDKGSMNGEFRQRQNDKIEEENRKLMHRLMTKKAKLATIEAIPNVGNFPRVSQTLDESDLKLVLVKLVQCIRVSSIHGATDAAASLKLTVEHIEHLRRELQPAAGKLTVANSSILDLIAQGMVPPRFVLRGKRATIHLCHARVFQLRRLLTFHAFDVRTHNVVNFQFTEEDLLPHFHISPLWPDIYRTLFKLAMKRIRI
ncbi:hypothetical protein DYB32_004711 [Aphanomyces invadans]|uniref:Uncharacterized protein n=1 Tax=Aphanomyces invadans TaxID=157072 RepID=A0A418AWP9_9STRA|nr:hypothetical protein DYB32_004711 [Aphanomyces invadans]